MFIWPQKDGSVTYTGSFNQEQWDAWQAEHSTKAKIKAEAKAAAVEPEPEQPKSVEPAPEPPAAKLVAPAARRGGG